MEGKLEVQLSLSAEKLDKSNPITLEELGESDIIYNGIGEFYEVKTEVLPPTYENHKEILNKINNFRNQLKRYNPDLKSVNVAYRLLLDNPSPSTSQQEISSREEQTQGDEEDLPF